MGELANADNDQAERTTVQGARLSAESRDGQGNSEKLVFTTEESRWQQNTMCASEE